MSSCGMYASINYETPLEMLIIFEEFRPFVNCRQNKYCIAILFNIVVILFVCTYNNVSWTWWEAMQKKAFSEKTIYFIETNSRINSTKLLKCALESASQAYPDYKVRQNFVTSMQQ